MNLSKAGQILVLAKYAEVYRDYSNMLCKYPKEMECYEEFCDPFANTLPGRQQLDALIDFFVDEIVDSYGITLWTKSEQTVDYPETANDYPDERQWSLDRIAWCIEEVKL